MGGCALHARVTLCLSRSSLGKQGRSPSDEEISDTFPYLLPMLSMAKLLSQ